MQKAYRSSQSACKQEGTHVQHTCQFHIHAPETVWATDPCLQPPQSVRAKESAEVLPGLHPAQFQILGSKDGLQSVATQGLLPTSAASDKASVSSRISG